MRSSRDFCRAIKAPTGIIGFDEITGGGLPRGRTTLLVGGPGSGKTILALQFLVHGAQHCKEPGIFVAFEESSKRIVANAESFGWNLAELRRKKLFFMDAQPMPDLVQSGNFDLSGMLAALEAQTQEMGARRIVFDALDVVLALLPDAAAKRREVYRLHEWLLARELTGLITAKAGGDEASSISQQPFGFMQFMVDCAVILNHSVVLGVSQRNLRVQKYRGSSFDENESPFLIGASGLEVDATRTQGRVHAKVSNERVSSGVKRLDTMLGGGYYRGASVLITGFPGTAKTTMSGAFAEAACKRGERTLFVSFDSDSNEVIRDLASVGIRLDRYVKNGRLRMVSARTITGSAETYLVRIKTLAKEHKARCLVIDPVSTWSKSGNDLTAHSVAERLIDWSKANGITLVCTSLLDEMSSQIGRRLVAADLDARGHLDPPQLPGAGRRAQPRLVHHQVARHGAFEPGARADPERCGRDAGRHLHGGRRSVDGHAALGKGKRRARRERGHRSRRQAQARQARCRGGRARGAREVAAGGARGEAGREGVAGPHHGESQGRVVARPHPDGRVARRRCGDSGAEVNPP